MTGGPTVHVPSGYPIPAQVLAAWTDEVRALGRTAAAATSALVTPLTGRDVTDG
ncbi:MAG: hypothetical protein JWQ53_1689 [Klenkia sp.]|nr:hypothetical protein [Klenkia sp.]